MQKVRRYQVSFFYLECLSQIEGHLRKKKTQQTSTVCSCQVSVSLSIPSWGSISPFPHGTCSLSVRTAFLGLEGGPPIFRQSLCSALLLTFLAFCHVKRLRGCHPLWPPFPGGFNVFHIILTLVRCKNTFLQRDKIEMMFFL